MKMTNAWLMIYFAICGHLAHAQGAEQDLTNPFINIRATLLLFPPTPVITTEFRMFEKVSLQLESNFTNTHGVNLKYFNHALMERDFLFFGLGFITNDTLREDEETVYLPYLGYGYAQRFGTKKQFTWDSRFGLGYLSNADTPTLFPVIKSGIGYLIGL